MSTIIYFTCCGSVAQSVEQWPFKPLVPGSSPGRPTIVITIANLPLDLMSQSFLRKQVNWFKFQFLRKFTFFNHLQAQVFLVR